MVRAPHSLEFKGVHDADLRFEGPTSRLTVRRLFRGACEVRYDFKAYPVSQELEAASDLLVDPLFRPDEGTWTDRDAAEGVVGASDDDLAVAVTLSSGLVEISREGHVIHGGEIGSSDTVLPRYPIRVHGTAPADVRGQFNFRLEEGDRFFGLGDKGGMPDRRNRRFLMHNRDALGYREYSDPLYKSIPFVIKWNPRTKVWMGLVILATDVAAADFGVESPYFFSFSLRNGPFRYAVFTGSGYRDILEKYTRLTGRPAFPPAFTFGFLGSSMDYTEPADAADRVQAYLDAVEEHDIPCEGLYLSSGYCKAADGRRYAFEWNRSKFPDPRSFVESIRSRGYHVSANIKPGILVSHPRYAEFAKKGFFVPDGEGRPYLEYYWGADASFWDFRRPNAATAWQALLNERLVDCGIDGIWNDNNEIEIEDVTVPAHSERSTFALRMCRISYENALDRFPDLRPWIITRSGGIGIQRYARTWSGDNTTSWESLRANQFMGISMGLSGLPYFGHDIGGFFGARPDPELFLRWCQSAVFQPRFVIHSWNDDGLPTEIWSYESIRENLRKLVLQHYEFLPYIYSQAFLAHKEGIPLQRSLALEFPDDAGLGDDAGVFLFGDDILAVLSLSPGQDAVDAALPGGCDWYDPLRGIRLRGGVTHAIDISEDSARYLVRLGGVVSRAPGLRKLDRDWLGDVHFDLYPGPGETRRVHFEDDGITALKKLRWSTYGIIMKPEGEGGWSVEVGRTDRNSWRAPNPHRRFHLNLPEGFAFDDGRSTASLPIPAPGGTVRLGFSGSYG